MSLSNANASFYGETDTDMSGCALAIGDVNNDGFDDILIGAYHRDDPVTNTGETYLFYGCNTTLDPDCLYFDMSLSNANASFYGEDDDDGSGMHLAMGDVNNDGFADILIGAVWRDDGSGDNQGETYLFYGCNTTLDPDCLYFDMNLSQANASFYGENASDGSGGAVNVGDINNDGFSDILIGASSRDDGSGDMQGETYLFYGCNTTLDPNCLHFNMNVSEANASFYGEEGGDRSGSAIAISDVNNDGFEDILIGAYLGYNSRGWTYLFYGCNITLDPDCLYFDMSLSNANASFYGITGGALGDESSYALAIGDVNNDDFSDILIGAYHRDDGAGVGQGETFLFFSKWIEFEYSESNFDFKNISLANNNSYLFAYIQVNGSIDLSDSIKYYRLFISADDSTGNETTPESDTSITFKYNYRIQVNGSKCYVYNWIDEVNNISSCLVANDSNSLEIGIPLSVLNAQTNDIINVTFETGVSTLSLDFVPDYRSFLSYDYVGTFDFTDPLISNLSITPQKVLDEGTINISANVTDANNISYVKALLYYPNGTQYQNLTMINGGGDIYYNDTYTIDFYPHGTYNVTIWANDSNGNINNFETSWFTPYINLSQEKNIIINGSFEDWGTVNITDNTDDTSPYSDPLNYNPRTCSDVWGDCGAEPGSEGDNTFNTCPTQGSTGPEEINEIWINATTVPMGYSFNVSCEMEPDPSYWDDDWTYIWYYNGTGWRIIANETAKQANPYNLSVNITADNIVGTHWVRCIIDYDEENDYCAGGSFYDNDDINITVINPFDITDFDLTKVSITNNNSYLFSYIKINNTLDYSDSDRYYRLFISTDDSTGNETTPEATTNLAFKYNYRIQVNTSKCYVYSYSNEVNNISSCLFANDSNSIEIGVPLSILNSETNDSINITFETGISTQSLDFAPDYRSFLRYDYVGDLSDPVISDLSITPQKALNGTKINITVNVADESSVSVKALLYYPNSTQFQNITLVNGGGNLYYNDTYTVSFYPHGTYNIKIWAEDSNGNTNNDYNEFEWYAPYLNLSQEKSQMLSELTLLDVHKLLQLLLIQETIVFG